MKNFFFKGICSRFFVWRKWNNAPTWYSSEEGDCPQGFARIRAQTPPSPQSVGGCGWPHPMPSQRPCSPTDCPQFSNACQRAKMTNLPVIMRWGKMHFSWSLLESTLLGLPKSAVTLRADFQVSANPGKTEARWDPLRPSPTSSLGDT